MVAIHNLKAYSVGFLALLWPCSYNQLSLSPTQTSVFFKFISIFNFVIR